jgi:putative CocE/NonD family hydrolase
MQMSAKNGLKVFSLIACAMTAIWSVCADQTFEEMVPMPDGVKLYTYGVRPAEGVKCPIVIVRNPYQKCKKADLRSYLKSQMPNLKRGYAFVMQHCRGTGMSEGEWIPYEYERADGLAFLEWIRKRPWYNGEIFLFGASYSATVHWAYLDTNPPDVKGAVLSVQEVDRYNIKYRNGFFKIGLHGNWFVKGYKKKNTSLQRDKSVNLTDFPLVDFSRRYWGVPEITFDTPLRHPDRNDPFWRTNEPGSGANCRNGLKNSTMPILLRTALYDIYTEGVLEMWRETSRERLANCALLVNAYDHGGRLSKEMKGTYGEFPGGSCADDGVEPVDWFDWCRTGEPLAKAMPGKVRHYALWENRWIEADALVDGPQRVEVPFGKGERGWVYDPKRPLPEFPGSGGICFGGMRKQPPPDFRDDVASFILPPVESRLDVRGRMRAKIAVKSDCEDTCFYARVSVRKPDGVWYLLRDDITSLSANGGDYRPGTERIVWVRFADHAFRLEKGDVLRVDVSSGNSQFAPHGNVKGLQNAVRNPKIAKNSVRADGSALIIFALDGK